MKIETEIEILFLCFIPLNVSFFFSPSSSFPHFFIIRQWILLLLKEEKKTADVWENVITIEWTMLYSDVNELMNHKNYALNISPRLDPFSIMEWDQGLNVWIFFHLKWWWLVIHSKRLKLIALWMEWTNEWIIHRYRTALFAFRHFCYFWIHRGLNKAIMTFIGGDFVYYFLLFS